jgi:hypothetical protein
MIWKSLATISILRADSFDYQLHVKIYRIEIKRDVSENILISIQINIKKMHFHMIDVEMNVIFHSK